MNFAYTTMQPIKKGEQFFIDRSIRSFNPPEEWRKFHTFTNNEDIEQVAKKYVEILKFNIQNQNTALLSTHAIMMYANILCEQLKATKIE